MRYTSYSECSRDEVQAARREAPFFIFETGLLMPRQNFSAMKRFMFKDHTPAEGIPCRLSKEAGLRRTHGMIHDGRRGAGWRAAGRGWHFVPSSKWLGSVVWRAAGA